MIAERLGSGVTIDEYFVQQFVRSKMAQGNLVTDSGPIVGANGNAGNPHYEPTIESFSPIRKGDLVLLDMWAKLDLPGAVFYDITWTGFCGSEVPSRIQDVFEVVRDARDKAIERVKQAFEKRELIRGFQVDDACRDHIKSRGFGDHFVHRTGLAIGR